MQQLDAEPRLEGGDMLGHHGLRQVERAGGGREAAEGGNPDENLHAGETIEQDFTPTGVN